MPDTRVPPPNEPVPQAAARALWVAPAAVFAVALLVTLLLLWSVTRSIAARDQAAFEAEATRTVDAVRERIDTTITLLYGVAGLFRAEPHVDQARFAGYMSQLRLRQRYPGIQGIGWSARILAADLAAVTARMRAQVGPSFHVWPAQPRKEYHSILYLEPLDERNQAAIGYDMFTDPTRRAAMARAWDEGRPAASAKLILVQEIDEAKQNGFLIYLPVYRGGRVPADLATRRAELEGFVYAPLRVGDLLRGVRGSGVRELDYELYDGIEARPEALMLSTHEPKAPPPTFVANRVLDVAGRHWLLRLGSRPEFESLSQRSLVPWMLLLSIGASALLAWITFVQARARRGAEASAQRLRRNEAALQDSEERARDRAEQLQQLYAELREGDRRKDEFLAVLAHELRNPLAPIRNALEILNRVPEGEAARRAREIAGRQLGHMVRLIDDLLDVSRISRGKIVLQRERLRLSRAVEAAVETSRPLIEARGHRLLVGQLPAVELEADPTRLAQILTNLLNNAANYTPAGGQIQVGATADAAWVRVAVRDNGIGIDPQRLAHVFELFTQIDQSGGGGGGLGIGLSLAERLARLHGGHIEAHSEGPGRGAEFVLVLPLAAQDGRETDAAGAG